MSMVRNDQADAWLPIELGKMLDLEIQAKSVAAKSSTIFPTNREKAAFPLWVSDPAVGFYDELDEITPADGDTAEVVVIPSKTAGLTLLSNELATDSDPQVALQVATGLARQIAEAWDTAFFGNTVAKGPNGLRSLAYTVVSAGSAVANLDAFVDARFAAEAHGAHVTAWLVHPDTAKLLTKLKTDSSISNVSLLAFVADGLAIAGVPVLTSTHVDANSIAWGVDQSQLRYVNRQTTEVRKFDSVTNDGQWVRGVSRVGFGFLNPAGVVRIMTTPITFTVTLADASSGDTWTLLVNGVATATIAYNAAASAVRSAIVAVDDGIDAADVTVTGDATAGYSVSLPATLAHGTDTGLTSTVVVA
jgi:HK97 family phage major capsid protein